MEQRGWKIVCGAAGSAVVGANAGVGDNNAGIGSVAEVEEVGVCLFNTDISFSGFVPKLLGRVCSKS